MRTIFFALSAALLFLFSMVTPTKAGTTPSLFQAGKTYTCTIVGAGIAQIQIRVVELGDNGWIKVVDLTRPPGNIFRTGTTVWLNSTGVLGCELPK